jgi:RNA polymerase sigma factor (sigma-70 family)
MAIKSITNDTFRGEATLNTYLHSIFYKKCIDYLRKKSSDRSRFHETVSIADILDRLPDKARPMIEDLMLKLDWEVLKKQLNLIGDKCRMLLLLSKDGYSTREIQESLGFKSADVVKTSRLRCLDKLKQMCMKVK